MAVAVAVAALGGAAPGVQVRVTGDRVAVEATAAPLSDILDALAAQTGMKVEYEGTPPRQLVTLAIHDRTPVEAVLGVLDGQSVDYAVQLDAERTRAVLLLITSTSGPTNRRPPPPASREPDPPPELPFEQTFEPVPEEAPVEEPAEPPQTPAVLPGGSASPARPPGPLLFPSPLSLPTPTPRGP